MTNRKFSRKRIGQALGLLALGLVLLVGSAGYGSTDQGKKQIDVLQEPINFTTEATVSRNGGLLAAGVLDTEVKTTKSIEVPATKDITKDELKKGIKEGLEKAAKNEKDEFLKDTMEKVAQNDGLLDSIASEVLDAFEECMDGYAKGVIRVRLNGDKATIGVINIQVITPPPADAPPGAKEKLKAHEDGHSFINDEIAKKLGPKYVNKLKGEENAGDMTCPLELVHGQV